jgi:hypothetical protein
MMMYHDKTGDPFSNNLSRCITKRLESMSAGFLQLSPNALAPQIFRKKVCRLHILIRNPRNKKGED